MAMTVGEVAWTLRKECLRLFGPGYPLLQQIPGGGHTFEDVYIYTWVVSYNAGQPAHGMSVVLMDICKRGGDDAMANHSLSHGDFGRFNATMAVEEPHFQAAIAALKANAS